MSGFSLRHSLARTKTLAVAAMVASTALGACIPMVPPGGGGAPAPQIRQQTFNDPQVGGRWLDVCYGEGACREQQSVDTFCQQQGFQSSVAHQSRATPLLQENVRIGDQTVCLATVGNCHRVTTVTCQTTG